MNSYQPSTARTLQPMKVSSVSETGSGTANGYAKTQETGSSHASPHRKRMWQENAYGQRSAMMKESAKAQSPTETDNHRQQSAISPKPTKKTTAREHSTVGVKPGGHENASMAKSAGNPHVNNQVMSEANRSRQKTSGPNWSGQKMQPEKAIERPEISYW